MVRLFAEDSSIAIWRMDGRSIKRLGCHGHPGKRLWGLELGGGDNEGGQMSLELRDI